jgi:HD-GYP domain-containing protein (c-di-GMP phosphodiesterase class II)
VPEVQTVSLGWSVLIGLTLICIQAVTLWIVCHKHNREMAAHVGAMAIITAAMQPREIRAHCRRVADMSEKIAQELILSAKRLALVRAAGILHEIDGIDGITTNVPLEFAILSVADYYDVLTHDGSQSMGMDEAMEEIRREVGTRYAPVVVRALMRVMMHSEAVAARE